MKTRDFDTLEEANAYMLALPKDISIDAYLTNDGKYRLSWVPNKKFTSIDGKEHIDEVWIKEDGTMIHCQDLEPEPAKNIIRMILRSKRAEAEVLANMTLAMEEAIDEIADKDSAQDADPENRVLH